jgi:hypothetical protein
MRGDESRITSLRVRGKLMDKADVAWRPLAGSSLALIGNASAQKAGAKTCSPSRGIFDKETRRKPLAFAADAAPMGIGGCFGTPSRCGSVGGLRQQSGCRAVSAAKPAAKAL